MRHKQNRIQSKNRSFSFLFHPRCGDYYSHMVFCNTTVYSLSFSGLLGCICVSLFLSFTPVTHSLGSAATLDGLSYQLLATPRRDEQVSGRVFHLMSCKQKFEAHQPVHTFTLWSQHRYKLQPKNRRPFCEAVEYHSLTPWPQTHSHRSAAILDGWSHQLLWPF